MKMRMNLKAILLSLTVMAVIITCAVYMRCADHLTFAHHLVGGRWDRRLYAVQSDPEMHEGDDGNMENNPNGSNLIETEDGHELMMDSGGVGGGGNDYGSNPMQDIECIINQEYSIRCKHDANTHEVYVPFTFLRHYFDVMGSLSASPPTPLQTVHHHSSSVAHASSSTARNMDTIDAVSSSRHHQMPIMSSSGSLRFFWMHSTGKINPPKAKYDARGVFMYFENYNVEMRDRVKCISAAEGVPVSTQWEKRGYFYPTQIAQFALSHYSKNLLEPEPRIRILENADDIRADWLLEKSSNLTRIWHPKFKTSIVQYETAIEYQSAIKLNYNNNSNNSINNNNSSSSVNNQMADLILDADVLLVTNSSSLMVILENRETKRTYRIHYIPAELLISVQDDNVYYGMGLHSLNRWHHLTRDLHVDVQKGLLQLDGMGRKSSPVSLSSVASSSSSSTTMHVKLKRNELRVVSVSFMGVGFFDNLTLASSNHMANFYAGAEWLVRNQDKETGGWPNPVRRSLNGFPELKAGWLSAMGQGHAISVLARAHWHSHESERTRYLQAAALALKPFQVPSKQGGVLAMFMDKYPWYEEYPTTPASFVLNGFIYSLLGLYDLHAIAKDNVAREAGRLYQQGLESLRGMLLLYDTGSGTSYDLRHLSLGVAPNLARWDYHATHVNQLLLLATLHNDTNRLVQRTAERWRGYMLGKRAKHN